MNRYCIYGGSNRIIPVKIRIFEVNPIFFFLIYASESEKYLCKFILGTESVKNGEKLSGIQAKGLFGDLKPKCSKE